MKRSQFYRSPFVLIILGLALYLPGIGWGVPGNVSWSQDTIAGFRTLGPVEEWPGKWQGRYPPLHYLILNAAYKPVLQHWDLTGQRVVDPDTGDISLKPPHPPKIGLLIVIARAVSVVMAIATVLGIRSATRLVTDDDLAGTLAGVAFMTSAAFTYFAHLGNVDVPSMCWFAWSLYFYLRLLRTGRWLDALLLGLLGSLAISTKDATAGVYPGMAIVLLAAETKRRMDHARFAPALYRTVWQPKWLIGLAAFALPYMLLLGIISNPEVYLERMRYWLDPAASTLHARQYRYPGQFELLGASISYAAGAVGWPMLVAIAASVAHTVRRRHTVAGAVLVPVISYYLLVIVQINFVYSRFLFAPLALLCILVGVAGAALLGHKRWPLQIRLGLPCVFLCVSMGYAAAIDLEMVQDSRYKVEAWFQANVTPPSSIGAFSHAQYLPRVNGLGYATYSIEMDREAFTKPQPEYLILTSYNYEDFDVEQQACLRDLLAGRLGYRLMADFRGRFLGTGSSWLSLAGWGAPVPGKISPTVSVLRRTVP
ncbi:MAG: ArnT family glycosyltransferase [Planctomycetota bacterium]|jgi:hypothetical protein